jgi:hypothetical protein
MERRVDETHPPPGAGLAIAQTAQEYGVDLATAGAIYALLTQPVDLSYFGKPPDPPRLHAHATPNWHRIGSRTSGGTKGGLIMPTILNWWCGLSGYTTA